MYCMYCMYRMITYDCIQLYNAYGMHETQCINNIGIVQY